MGSHVACWICRIKSLIELCYYSSVYRYTAGIPGLLRKLFYWPWTFMQTDPGTMQPIVKLRLCVCGGGRGKGV